MHAAANIIFQSTAGPRALRTQTGPWKIFSVLDRADADIAKAELAGGADGLVLTTVASISALRNLPLHNFSIRNEAGDAGAKALVDLVAKQPIDPARLDINLGVTDPNLADEFSKLGFLGPFFDIHAETVGEALVAGAAVVERGFKTSVRLSADHTMFATLAKFRAMRIVWQRAFPHAALHLHAQTAAPQSDDHEHYLLNCVAACFGAGLGGADSISILPLKADGLFERRMVRNIQNILLKESHLGEVADAAAGAGYIEHLTREICAAAWEKFRP